jgi:hypothetical protein
LAVSKDGMRKAMLAFVCLTQVCRSQTPREQDAVAAILQQFERHPIVMFGEIHGCVQEHALLKKLLTSPEFAARVNDVVIEMGNALYQDVLDRYIAGENVPMEQLRKTWENQVGAPGGNPTPPYHGLLAAVREANQKLPRERRLRVLAGDPPIEWEHVESRQDIAPFLPFRDEHFASVVRYEVLAKRRKALLVMGAGHFQRREGKPGVIEQQMLAAFTTPYVMIAGSDVVGTYDDVDGRFAQHPWPWLMELKGSWLSSLTRRADVPGIGFPAIGNNPAPAGTWDQVADAYVFLGPRDQLTQGGEAFDLNGTAYGSELRRRWKILFPKPPDELPRSDGKERPMFVRSPPPPPALPRKPAP